MTYYKEYRLPFDYGFIDELVFYTSDDCLNTYARRAIENGTKTLFFINDINTATSLFRRYRDKALFNCSPANVKAYKSYVDEVKIRNMLKNERFEENLLITTTVMDCGVNLKDMDIKEIVMDVKDVDSLQQCIGRKRILDQVDKVKIYIKFYDNRVINGLKSSAVFGIEHANYLRKYGEEAYEKRYPREPDRSGIVYMINKQYRINELMYFKRKRDVEIWDEVMRPDGEKKMNMGGVNIWQKNWEDIMKITIGMITKWTVKSHYLNFLKIWSRIK